MTLWYLARASGVVAMVAFTVATALGALTAMRPLGRRVRSIERRLLLQLAHRAAAVTGLGLAAVHVATTVTDSQSGVSATAILVPFSSTYAPIAVGLGTIALYLTVLVTISGATRGRLAAGAGASGHWRSVHRLSYLAWALMIGHGLFAGIDAASSWLLMLTAGCILLVLGSLGLRYIAAATQADKSLAASRTRANAVFSTRSSR